MQVTKLVFLLLVLGLAFQVSAETYLTKKEFINLVVQKDSQPETKTLWLDKALQKEIKAILDHKYPKLRLKYWQNQNQTIWFLEEIGKEKPITFGISVKGDKVNLMKVLTFRESRGWEIRYESFSRQFDQIGVDSEGKLDKHIDGITGATMSVTAMKKIARLALLLHKKVNQ